MSEIVVSVPPVPPAASVSDKNLKRKEVESDSSSVSDTETSPVSKHLKLHSPLHDLLGQSSSTQNHVINQTMAPTTHEQVMPYNYHQEIVDSENERTVFISGVTGSFYGHCLKPRVNVEHDIYTILKNKPNKIILSKKGKYVKVVCSDKNQKQRLMCIDEISGFHVKVTEPYSITGNRPAHLESNKPTAPLAYKVVVRGVPEEYGTEDIEQLVDAHKIKLFKKEGATTSTAILTYNTQDEIPDSVTLEGEILQTEGYIPRPLRCDRCQLYGHHKTICKSKKVTCSFCSEQHTYEECPVKGDYEKAKCRNCPGKHSSAHRKCPKYIEISKILRIRAEKKTTYREAKKEAAWTNPNKTAAVINAGLSTQHGKQMVAPPVTSRPHTPFYAVFQSQQKSPYNATHEHFTMQSHPTNTSSATTELNAEFIKLQEENNKLKQQNQQLQNKVQFLEDKINEITVTNNKMNTIGDVLAILVSVTTGVQGQIARERLTGLGYEIPDIPVLSAHSTNNPDTLVKAVLDRTTASNTKTDPINTASTSKKNAVAHPAPNTGATTRSQRNPSTSGTKTKNNKTS